MGEGTPWLTEEGAGTRVHLAEMELHFLKKVSIPMAVKASQNKLSVSQAAVSA